MEHKFLNILGRLSIEKGHQSFLTETVFLCAKIVDPNFLFFSIENVLNISVALGAS
jgi:hypothetical protein